MLQEYSSYPRGFRAEWFALKTERPQLSIGRGRSSTEIAKHFDSYRNLSRSRRMVRSQPAPDSYLRNLSKTYSWVEFHHTNAPPSLRTDNERRGRALGTRY